MMFLLWSGRSHGSEVARTLALSDCPFASSMSVEVTFKKVWNTLKRTSARVRTSDGSA
jgi:hypothetical protein